MLRSHPAIVQGLDRDALLSRHTFDTRNQCENDHSHCLRRGSCGRGGRYSASAAMDNPVQDGRLVSSPSDVHADHALTDEGSMGRPLLFGSTANPIFLLPATAAVDGPVHNGRKLPLAALLHPNDAIADHRPVGWSMFHYVTPRAVQHSR